MSIFLNYVVKAIQLLNCDTLKVHGKSPKYKYVDDRQRYRAHRIMIVLADAKL